MRTRKPGYLFRAILVLAIGNLSLIGLFAVARFTFGDALEQWWALVPLLFAGIAAEASMIGATIGPVLSDWVNQYRDS